MPWTDHDGPLPSRPEEQLLALARAKAHAMGRRRHRQVGAGFLTAVLVVVGLVAVVARDEPAGDTKLETVAGGLETSTSMTTSTTAAEPTTSTSVARAAATSSVPLRPPPTAPAVTPFPSVSSTTTPTTTPAAVASTTTTTLLCRNSHHPACGPLVWDPPPGPNQPLTVQVTVTPQAPKAGETVTFRVVVDDPDGNALQAYDGTVDYGDGTPFYGVGGHVECAGFFGPWDSTPVPVHQELAFKHVYANAGTYTATFRFATLGNCAYGPSQATATATVVVTKPPS